MLESFQHEASFFVTLTYSDEEVPADGSVSVREGQLFLKRVRERIAPERLRFFLVGEYGDTTLRPHYHACLFGVRDPVAIEECWSKGFVQCLPFSRQLAQYLAGYTVKKMTAKDDPRLEGRHPEFARMSLRPGIGAGAVGAFKRALVDPDTGEIRMQVDVPASFRLEKKMWPLGRYLMRRLRGELGMELGQPVVAAELKKMEERLRYPTWKDRDEKEHKRQHDADVARVRHSIARSRKGL